MLAEGALAGAVRVREREDGWIVLGIPSSDEETFAALVLEYGPSAEVLEPATLRGEVIRRLEELARA